MFKKVISGGQCGADQAGLFAAMYCGLETGGWIPKGFKTEKGPMSELATFGLKETESSDYGPRTELNVMSADATIIIAMDAMSPGSRMTQKAADDHKKPVIGCGFFTNTPPDIEKTARNIAQWIVEYSIETLNVAGNRESLAPGLQKWATQMLARCFKIVKDAQS
jgi:hypothetical protein